MENKVICKLCKNEFIVLRATYKRLLPLEICINCRDKINPELLRIGDKLDSILPLMIEAEKQQEKVNYYDRLLKTQAATENLHKKAKEHQQLNPSCQVTCEHWEELQKECFPGQSFEEVKERTLEWMNAILTKLKNNENKCDI